MKGHKLQPLRKSEKIYAEENHNLVYGFLHRYGYSIEEYYNVVIFGYLKAVQVYHRREDLQEKCDFAFISWQYMRAEIGNHFRMENSKKRKPEEKVSSLNYSDMENMTCSVNGKSPEADVIENLLLETVLDNLKGIQREIVRLKISGYSNKEIYMLLGIPSSTYYKELQRIRIAVEELLIG